MERELISIRKATERTGVTRRTIYNWMRSGKIEYMRTAGGAVRIFLDTLLQDAKQVEARPEYIAKVAMTKANGGLAHLNRTP